MHSKSRSEILVFAPNPTVRKWIAEELAGEQLAIEARDSVADIALHVITEPTPGPDVVVVDFDEMQAADVEQLHSIRDVWSGTLIALGEVPREALRRMGAVHVVVRPLGSESLRKLVIEATREVPTAPMSKLEL